MYKEKNRNNRKTLAKTHEIRSRGDNKIDETRCNRNQPRNPNNNETECKTITTNLKQSQNKETCLKKQKVKICRTQMIRPTEIATSKPRNRRPKINEKQVNETPERPNLKSD